MPIPYYTPPQQPGAPPDATVPGAPDPTPPAAPNDPWQGLPDGLRALLQHFMMGQRNPPGVLGGPGHWWGNANAINRLRTALPGTPVPDGQGAQPTLEDYWRSRWKGSGDQGAQGPPGMLTGYGGGSSSAAGGTSAAPAAAAAAASTYSPLLSFLAGRFR